MMKYRIDYTSNFKKQYKKLVKQGKDLDKLYNVIEMLANGIELDKKYRNHNLINDKKYYDCKECHIGPDWLLVYRIINDELILLLVGTGSHSEIF